MSLALTDAQYELLDRARKAGGAVHVTRGQVRSARVLENLKLGTLTDDGIMLIHGRIDGERYTFTASEAK